jgi:hypothetical protein
MTTPQAVDLNTAEAADLLHSELTQAEDSLRAQDLDAAVDNYVRALGLALQLGPAPTEQALVAILGTARELAGQHHAVGRPSASAALSALGPALVGLVAQVCDAGVLPATSVMEAWAIISSEIGALIGQLGLALALPADHRTGMLDNARTRAALLDGATNGIFTLTAWLEEIQA